MNEYAKREVPRPKVTLITLREVGVGRTKSLAFEIKRPDDLNDNHEVREVLDLVLVARRRCWEALDGEGKPIGRGVTAAEAKERGGARVRRKVQRAVLLCSQKDGHNITEQAMMSAGGFQADYLWNLDRPVYQDHQRYPLVGQAYRVRVGVGEKGQVVGTGKDTSTIFPVELQTIPTEHGYTEHGLIAVPAGRELYTFAVGWLERLAPWCSEWPEPESSGGSRWVL